MNWLWKVLRWFGRFYFVRFQLVVLLAHIVLPVLAFVWGEAVVGGLFRDLGPWLIFSAALFSGLSVASAAVTLCVTLGLGDERFKHIRDLKPLRDHWAWPLLITLALIVPLVALCWESAGGRLWAVFGAVAGTTLAAVVVVVVFWIYAWLRPKSTELLSFPSWMAWVSTLLKNRASRESPFETGGRLKGLVEWVNNCLRGVFPKPGYFDSGHWLYPEHAVAIGLFVFSTFLYLGFSFGKLWFIGDDPRLVPTVAYLFMLIMLLCWTFSGLAFLLDRYRFPIWLIALVVMALASLAGVSDHYYETHESVEVKMATPGDVLRKKGAHPILISAVGGGIATGSWVAQVCQGIEEALGPELGSEFRNSVALISGTSGGAVGGMYYANTYRCPNGCKKTPFYWATRSSLDEIAWGFVFPDIARIFFPSNGFFQYADRGWALGETFHVRQNEQRGENVGSQALLSDWANAVREGAQPAVIFNATIAETGQPLLFSTSSYPAFGSDNELHYRQLLRPDRDVRVATAARLSAAFPYVSPAARADDGAREGAEERHLVDGGYYDNYGIASLIGWLHAGLTELSTDSPARLPRRVLILQIDAEDTGDPGRGARRRGWPYQTTAPIQALAAVWFTAQRIGNSNHVTLLHKAWQIPEILHVPASYAADFEEEEPPLSWRLRKQDIKAIERVWTKQKDQIVRSVKDFLNGREVAGDYPSDKGKDLNIGE